MCERLKKYSFYLKLFFIFYLFPIDIWGSNIFWDAKVRYRFRTDTSPNKFDEATSTYSEMRSRIGLRILAKNASVNFIIQDSRILGNEEIVIPSFHEAHFNFRIFNNLIQIGRLEFPLGQERLVARKNWNNSGQSFDGLVLKRNSRLGRLNIFSFKIKEEYPSFHDNIKDSNFRGAYLFLDFLKDTPFKTPELYLFNYRYQSSNDDQIDLYTGGTRVEIWISGPFYFEGELAFQRGEKISSSMYSSNIIYKPENKNILKYFSVGFDFISGDDSRSKIKTGFSKLFGAGHKYHGYYDYQLHKDFGGNIHNGLLEYNVKTNLRFFYDSSFLLTYHHFRNQINKSNLGQEIDFLIKKNISEELSFSLGTSLYWPQVQNDLPALFYLIISASLH